MANKLRFTFYTTPGLTDLRAQLFDDVGDEVGSPIDTGFVERGTNGMYIWVGDPGDGFEGGVEFYSFASASNILAIRDISPKEVENNDVKVSSLEITTAVMQAIADIMNARSVSHVEDTAEENSHAELVLALLNSTTVGATWTIKKTGGTTFNTRTLTLDPTAQSVTGVA